MATLTLVPKLSGRSYFSSSPKPFVSDLIGVGAFDEGVDSADGTSTSTNTNNQTGGNAYFELEPVGGSYPADFNWANVTNVQTRVRVRWTSRTDDTVVYATGLMGLDDSTFTTEGGGTFGSVASGGGTDYPTVFTTETFSQAISGGITTIGGSSGNVPTVKIYQSTFTQSMGADGSYLSFDAIDFVLTYTPTVTSHALEGAAAGTSSATGAVSVTKTLQGAAAGDVDAAAELTVVTPVAHALEGDAAATSSATGKLAAGSASGAIVATGGTISNIDGYTVHTFNADGDFEIQSGTGDVEYLVIAGGGGGGSRYVGGGGGAGGVLAGTKTSMGPGVYQVKVGAGGLGGTSAAFVQGGKGGNSKFDTIIAEGGGGGGAWSNTGTWVGLPGGSGGGGGQQNGDATATILGGTGTVGQGYDGGTGGLDDNIGGGGGGGGGGGAGQNSANLTNQDRAAGGAPYYSSITGVSTPYAEGGGGGVNDNTLDNSGGYGGLNVTTPTGRNGTSGATNTGSGGGGAGGRSTYTNAGNGGSGIVIVRYATPTGVALSGDAVAQGLAGAAMSLTKALSASATADSVAQAELSVTQLQALVGDAVGSVAAGAALSIAKQLVGASASTSAQVIGSEIVLFDTSANPAAQNITVPAGCTAVYVFGFNYHSSIPSGFNVVTLDGGAPDQEFKLNDQQSVPAGNLYLGVWYNPAIGTQALDWLLYETSINGPLCQVIYVSGGNTTSWRDMKWDNKTNGQSATCTVNTQPGDLVIKFDGKYATALPTLSSGWTNIVTDAGNNLGVRISSKLALSTTEVCDATTTSYPGVIGISIPSGGVGISGTANAALSVDKPLTGSAVVQSQAAALLAVSKALAGDAQASGQATGDLTTGVTIEGAAAAQSSAAAALSVSKLLIGNGLSTSEAAAALSIGKPLQGAAAVSGDAAADLTAGSSLFGDAFGTIQATGGLSVTIPLAGTAAGDVDATGALSKTSSLAGAATAGATAAANLSKTISLAGAAISVSGATGAVSKTVPLAGAALVGATTGGGLILGVTLNGAALAQATAEAALTALGSSVLAGSASVSSVGSAILFLSIHLAGDAEGGATASAGMDVPVALTGDAIAQAEATGTLLVTLQLTGNAAMVSAASGGLSITTLLTGNASIQATGVGAAFVTKPLAGGALTKGTASASLFAAQTSTLAFWNIGGVFYLTQPYVNDNGVWKPATAFYNLAGVWH